MRNKCNWSCGYLQVVANKKDKINKQIRLKTPFKITFQKDMPETSNIELLENFKENFILSNCDFVDIMNSNELRVENEMTSFGSRFRYNLWIGIAHAQISIVENKIRNTKTVKYCINYTWLFSVYIILFIALTIFAFYIFGFNEFLFISTILIVLFVMIVLFPILITFLRHKSIFNETIKFGASYVERYDWKSILENKTDIELIEIIKGRTHLPKSISILAKKVLENRDMMEIKSN